MAQTETDPRSLTAYWTRLQQNFSASERGQVTLRSLLEAKSDYLTAGRLAELVAPNLVADGVIEDEANWTAQKQHPLLRRIEETGSLLRVPKVQRESDFFSIRNNWVAEWLRGESITADAPDTLPTGEGACMVHYLGESFRKKAAPSVESNSDADTKPTAPTTLPIEASFYTAAQQVATIRDPDVAIAVGGLDTFRNTDYYTILSELDLGVTLPDEDDAYANHTRTHDFAIAGLLRGVTEATSGPALERRLRVQMGALVAAAQEMYEAEQGDTNPGELHTAQLNPMAFVSNESVDAPLERFGMDAAYDEAAGEVRFGAYTRKQYPKQSQVN